MLLDAKADLLVYGNAERQIAEIAHRLAAGKPIQTLTDIRGTAFVQNAIPEGWSLIDPHVRGYARRDPAPIDPYAREARRARREQTTSSTLRRAHRSRTGIAR